MIQPIHFTDEDRAALAAECAAFRRGVAAALRALRRETPLAHGSIAVVERVLDACRAPTAERIVP